MNYLQALKFGSYKLRLNKIDTHILDSELLLSFVLKSSREQILTKLNSNIKKNNFEEFKKTLISKIPAGNLGTGEDVSNCVAFLASDLANYINGETIHVNGGMYMA